MAFSTDFNSIISLARQNADALTELARNNLDTASQKITDIGYDDIQWQDITNPADLSVGTIPDIPPLANVTLVLPTAPDGAAEMRDIPNVDVGAVPENPFTAPVYLAPNKPNQIGASPEKPDVNFNLDFPDAPDILIPEAPVFVVRDEPEAPEIVLPEFEGDFPDDPEELKDQDEKLQGAEDEVRKRELSLRNFAERWIYEQNPEHFRQIERLEAELKRYIEGGTGIKLEVEQAIINRARAAQSQEAEANKQAAYTEAASRGFTLPTGALMSAVARARQNANNNVNKAITDLAVAQMEMEQKNLQFAITTSAGLRTVMLNASLAYMDHIHKLRDGAMDYAKQEIEVAIRQHNAALDVFKARVDGYRTAAAVYDTQIKVALSKMDLFKAQVDALKTLTDADQSKVSLYNAQISSLGAVVSLYQSKIDAIKGKASLEKIKLEVYQAETQAFSSQVQAKNAEWSAYSAELSGEETKVRMYNAQLASYNAQLDAYRAKIAAKLSEVDAITKENQANTDRYQALVQSYTATVDAESKRAMAENENNRQVLSAFNGELAAFKAQTDLALATYTAQAEVNIKNATGSLSAQVEANRGKLGYGTALADVATSVGKVYSDLAGAAMSGINTLVAGNEDA